MDILTNNEKCNILYDLIKDRQTNIVDLLEPDLDTYLSLSDTYFTQYHILGEILLEDRKIVVYELTKNEYGIIDTEAIKCNDDSLYVLYVKVSTLMKHNYTINKLPIAKYMDELNINRQIPLTGDNIYNFTNQPMATRAITNRLD